MTSLSIERTKDGFKLSHNNGKSAGILAPYCHDNGTVNWQFMVNDRCVGPMRRSREAAEYDALAYWAEEAA